MQQMLAKTGFRPLAAIAPSWPVVLNQFFNSAANFVVTIVLVRAMGLAEFGHFTVYFLVGQSIVAILAAALVMPAVSIAAAADRDHRHSLLTTAGALVVAGALGVLALLACIQAAFTLIGNAPQVLLLPFGVLFATMVLNDLARRLLLFERALAEVWLFDVLRYVAVAVVLLWGVGGLGGLSASVAMTGLAAAYAIALAGLAAMSAGTLRALNFADFAVNARRLVKTGKWLTASAGLQMVLDNIFLFVGAAVAGNEAVGIVRTAQTLVGLVNPLFLTLEHIYPRHIGQLAKRRGWDSALDEYARLAVATVAGLLIVLAGLALFAEPILRLTAGEAAASHAWVMQAICLSWAPYLVFAVLTFPLRAIEKTRAIAISLTASAIVAAAISIPIVTGFGIGGMVGGMIVANLTTAIVLALQYAAIRRGLAP